MNKIKYFEPNTKGRDLIVGDIHGCLEDLLLALKALNFDEKVDRLFSVGDLIDRGPNSYECAQLIYKDWFHAIRGNHEDMMIRTILRGEYDASRMWIDNGGDWIYKQGTYEQQYSKEDLKELALDLDELPLVIIVGTGEKRFNIVHAEFRRAVVSQGGVFAFVHTNVNDQDVDRWTFSSADEQSMMWGRTLIRGPIDQQNLQKGLSETFVGHTPVYHIVRAMQQMYIDTGCVYHYISNKRDGQALTFAEPREQVVHMWSPAWKKLTTKPFAEIPTVQELINKNIKV